MSAYPPPHHPTLVQSYAASAPSCACASTAEPYFNLVSLLTLIATLENRHDLAVGATGFLRLELPPYRENSTSDAL